jgi:hypothetical protein
MLSTISAPAHFGTASGPLLLKFDRGGATNAPLKVHAVDPKSTFVLASKLMDDIDRAITMIPRNSTGANLRELRALLNAFSRNSAAISALTSSNGGNFREIADLNYRSSVADHFIQQFVQSLGLATIQSALTDRADFVQSVAGMVQRLERAKAALIGAQKPLTNAILLSGTAYKRKLDDLQREFDDEESAHPCKSKSILQMQARDAVETELAEFMADNVNQQRMQVEHGAMDLQDMSQTVHEGVHVFDVINMMDEDVYARAAPEIAAAGKI